MRGGAQFDPTETYRYSLWRDFENGQASMLRFVMLNPSTADAEQDDPTIRRCMGFARDWGFGGVLVVNLFALRATNPRELRRHPDPIGPDNDSHIEWALQPGSSDGEPPLALAAWGAHGEFMGRGKAVLRRYPFLRALGLTAAGEPRHPLYLRRDAVPVQVPS